MLGRRGWRGVMLAIVAGAILFAALACSIGGSGGDGGVRLINNLDVPICYVLISPSSDPDWGEDWLGPSEMIDPGERRDFDVAPGQEYDFQALDCDQNVLDEQRGIEVTSGGVTWQVR